MAGRTLLADTGRPAGNARHGLLRSRLAKVGLEERGSVRGDMVAETLAKAGAWRRNPRGGGAEGRLPALPVAAGVAAGWRA